MQPKKISIKKKHRAPIVNVKYSPSGKYLISADQEGKIVLWLNHSFWGTKSIFSPHTPLTGVWFSEDEEWLISGHQHGYLLVLSLPKLKISKEIQLGENTKKNILSGTSRPILNWVVHANMPMGNQHLNAALEFRDFYSLQYDSLKIMEHKHFPGSLIDYTTNSKTENHFFFGDDLGSVYKYDFSTRSLIFFAVHQEVVKAYDRSFNPTTKLSATGIAGLALSADEKLLATSSRTGGIQIWETQKKQELSQDVLKKAPKIALKPRREVWLRGLSFFQGASNIVSGGDDGIIETGDINNESLEVFTKCDAGVRDLTCSPSGDQIAIGCDNGLLYFIDT
jgi:WD40 repeat protein